MSQLNLACHLKEITDKLALWPLDVWLTLFQVCWEYIMVLFIWKESVVVPVYG